MENNHIIYPSVGLSDYIKYYWIVNTDNERPVSIQTIPSGCLHVVFHRDGEMWFSDNYKQPKSFVRGQLSKPGKLESRGKIDMIAVVFQPLGMNPFLRHPIAELYNQYIDIDCLEDKGLRDLKELISSEPNVSVCIRLIESFFIKRFVKNDYNYNRINHSIQTIKSNPLVKIESLTGDACLGYRHFKRIFTEYMGMGPKEYYRIVRFQRVLHTLQHNPGIGITRLACDCGFYDHSHLIKDFKTFSGYSPTHYTASRMPHSTLFSNYCKLNRIRVTVNTPT